MKCHSNSPGANELSILIRQLCYRTSKTYKIPFSIFPEGSCVWSGTIFRETHFHLPSLWSRCISGSTFFKNSTPSKRYHSHIVRTIFPPVRRKHNFTVTSHGHHDVSNYLHLDCFFKRMPRLTPTQISKLNIAALFFRVFPLSKDQWRVNGFCVISIMIMFYSVSSCFIRMDLKP